MKKLTKKPSARKTSPKKLMPRKGHIFVLRTCNADMSSAHDPSFIWPKRGLVKAPDWNPTPSCGRGLHGFAKGEGDAFLASSADDAKWLIVEVAKKTIVQLDGKIKFPHGRVVFVGSRDDAVACVQAAHPEAVCIYGTATAGNYGTATAGDHGTATAGDHGTATAGDEGTATAGNYGMATAGDHGTATAGNGGTATAGNGGTATAGDGGTATAGYKGTATAGNYGTATAGDYGTATAGNGGTATAGYKGTATAGDGGTLVISFWKGARRRIAVAYVGENGIEANIPYRLDKAGKFVRA